MKIFLHNKPKRILAILLSVAVLCCSFGVTVNTVATGEDKVIVNDGTSTDKITIYNSAVTLSVEDGVSPDGEAFSVGSTSKSGAAVIFYKFSNANADEIKNMQAFSFWTKVSNTKHTLIPNFNGEGWRFAGKIVAYNIYTGETIEADGSGGIVLPAGFEGYVVLDLGNGRVKNAWGETPNYSWSEFVTEKGISSFGPYTFLSEIFETPVMFDTFAFSANYEDYLTNLKAQPLLTMMPYSDVPSGIVTDDTRISLFASEGTKIYYTIDGTEPTEASNIYELVDLGDGSDPVSPILINSNTTIKAIAVKDGIISRTATFSYEMEPPYSGPMDIIINDYSGEGNHKCNWHNGKFESSYIDGISADGKAMQIKLLTPHAYADYLVLGTETTGVEQLYNVQAISCWLKVPATVENGSLDFTICVNGQNAGFIGKIYALDTKKRTVQIFRNVATLSDFEGLLIFDIKNSTLNINYGASTSTWKKYIKQNGLSSIFSYIGKKADASNQDFEFYMDSFQIHYDYQAVLDRYEIEEIILENTPNVEILNSGEDINKASNNKLANTLTVEEGISPDGMAYDLYGISRTGASSLYFDLTQLDQDILSLKEAFSTWIRVPSGVKYSFNPSFNAEGFNFIGKISTYNTLTGEIETYEDASSVELSNFEGYVFLHLKDCGVRKQWTGETPFTWDEFIVEKGVKKLYLYHLNNQNYANHISMDSFAFVSNLDKFIEELKAQPLRTMAPYSDTPSGAVPSQSFIYLYAQDGTTDIYFTLDGTTPTLSSTKYALRAFGNGVPDVSPITLVADTTIKAIAVKDGVISGVSTWNYTIEPPYDGPKDIIINNGDGEGKNTVGWSNGKFTHSYVDDISPDGKAIKVEFNVPDNQYVDYYLIRTETAGVEQLHNIEALSLWVKVPKLPDGKKITIALSANDAGNRILGKIYAYNMKDNTVKISNDYVTLDDFEGVIICVIDGDKDLSLSYGKETTDWYSYFKKNDLTSIWFYNSKAKNEGSDKVEYYIDSMQIHYDVDALFEKYDIAGLLTKYDVCSAENTNMTVVNDCSGVKVNGGLSEISDNLLLEFSDYSPDDRCFKVNFTKGDSTIGLPNFSTDENNLISDGITFWVDAKDAKNDIELIFKINEIAGDGKEELFEYSQTRWYYLIDKDGNISKVFGKLILPDNFRGWVVFPKESLLYTGDEVNFVNGEVDCDKVGTFTITFKNDNDKLNGKSIYFDDIGFYLDFPTFVRSHARAWKSQIFY